MSERLSSRLKIIDKAPVIEQYQNERQVEFVFDVDTYHLWIDNAEEPLSSASILARNSAITRVEMLTLEKDCGLIRKDPDEDGLRSLTMSDLRRGGHQDSPHSDDS